MVSPTISGRRLSGGFTLVELMIVMAIIALLLTIALPRYFDGLQRAKEAALRQDLVILRDNVDKYFSDKGIRPSVLEDLVSARYLHSIPVDPVTESAETWLITLSPDPQLPGIIDVHSGAEGNARDGSPFLSW